MKSIVTKKRSIIFLCLVLISVGVYLVFFFNWIKDLDPHWLVLTRDKPFSSKEIKFLQNSDIVKKMSQNLTSDEGDAQSIKKELGGESVFLKLKKPLTPRRFKIIKEQLAPRIKDIDYGRILNREMGDELLGAKLNAKFKTEVSEEAMEDLCHTCNLELEDESKFVPGQYLFRVKHVGPSLAQPGLACLQVKAGGNLDFAALESRPLNIDLAFPPPETPNHNREPCQLTIDDPQQWHLQNEGEEPEWVFDADMDAEKAWPIERGDEETVIAVIDLQFNTSHTGFNSKLWKNPGETPGNAVDDDGDGFPDNVHGWNFRDKSGYLAIDDGSYIQLHGNGMAGLAAAKSGESLALEGACPECLIMPIMTRNLDFYFAEALYYALDQYLRHRDGGSLERMVVVGTWGRLDDRTILREAIQKLAVNGIVLVFAAGNDPGNGVAYPAAYPETISFASTNFKDVSLVNDMSWGENLDLLAPSATKCPYRAWQGLVTWGLRKKEMALLGGTSAASALGAGASGLLLSLNPSLHSDEIRAILQQSGKPIPLEKDGRPSLTVSRINLHQALLPFARIKVLPTRPSPGQPFDVVVEASAPFGVGRISWKVDGLPGFTGSKAFSGEKTVRYPLPNIPITSEQPQALKFVITVESFEGWPDGYPVEKSWSYPVLLHQ